MDKILFGMVYWFVVRVMSQMIWPTMDGLLDVMWFDKKLFILCQFNWYVSMVVVWLGLYLEGWFIILSSKRPMSSLYFSDKLKSQESVA